MRTHTLITAFVFTLIPLSTVADTQPQPEALAHCLTHKPGCADEIVSALSKTDSPAFEKHLFDAIVKELQDIPSEHLHTLLRKLPALESETAFTLFWKSVRNLKLDFSKLTDDLEAGRATFSPSFQRFTQRLIKQNQDFELASIYFDLLYFFEDSEWSDLDRLVDLTLNLYLETEQSGALKPGDAALVKHLLLENSANQLDKDVVDYARLQRMWRLAENINTDPVSAYEKLSGEELSYTYRSEYYKTADRYLRDFSTPGSDGKLPGIIGQPSVFYEMRTQRVLANRLWSNPEGHTLLIDADGELLAFDGEKLVQAGEIWKIYRLVSGNGETGLFTRALEMAASGVSTQYESITYAAFADTPGPERRSIFVNHSFESDSETANYVELTQRSKRILLSMDLPDDESGVSVRQFVIEFKTPKDATAAFNDLSTSTPEELTETSLWYHRYDKEKQGLILRAYIHESEGDILISPYEYEGKSLDFPKWGECNAPFSIETLNNNSPAFFKEEDRLYRQGYKLQYFNLNTACTITMPWDAEADLVKRVIAGFEHYGNTEAIESLKSHRTTTRPYQLVFLDRDDPRHLNHSRIGGEPAIPTDLKNSFTWPQITRNNKAVPLEFLMQINLSELNNPHWNDDLPDNGQLSIFYATDEYGDPTFARGYYFENTNHLVRLNPTGVNGGQNSSHRLNPQRILFSDQPVEQYPIREWGAPYDRHNIVGNINKTVIQTYYDTTYGIGAYSKDQRASFVVDRDYPVFIQLKLLGEDLHIILEKADFNKPASNGFKTIRVMPDWMGHYD